MKTPAKTVISAAIVATRNVFSSALINAGLVHSSKWFNACHPKTDVGMFAPIRMVNITNVDSTPEIEAAVVFTPTFIITDGDREITRMEGYMSEDFFWGVLEMILERETEFKATGR